MRYINIYNGTGQEERDRNKNNAKIKVLRFLLRGMRGELTLSHSNNAVYQDTEEKASCLFGCSCDVMKIN